MVSGAAMLAAVALARERGAAQIVVAVPFASPEAVAAVLPLVQSFHTLNLRAIPANAHATIVMVSGAGADRRAPRNMFVASELNGAGFATLLFDLLTPKAVESRL
jgi:hypothetical protein